MDQKDLGPIIFFVCPSRNTDLLKYISECFSCVYCILFNVSFNLNQIYYVLFVVVIYIYIYFKSNINKPQCKKKEYKESEFTRTA